MLNKNRYFGRNAHQRFIEKRHDSLHVKNRQVISIFIQLHPTLRSKFCINFPFSLQKWHSKNRSQLFRWKFIGFLYRLPRLIFYINTSFSLAILICISIIYNSPWEFYGNYLYLSRRSSCWISYRMVLIELRATLVSLSLDVYCIYRLFLSTGQIKSKNINNNIVLVLIWKNVYEDLSQGSLPMSV